MISQTQLIIDWISTLGWDDRQELGFPLVAGPFVPPSPDRLVVITGGGGPGYLTEEATIDGSNFQVRLRAAPEDPAEGEVAASLLDDLILRASFPVQIDGVTIATCSRVGSGPSPMPWDPADQRVEFTSNYMIATGV
ncbi:MAG TPA: minor capsid protein [Streptosporangiaceae bacterium]|nr:minor capsid protein [Streptosporangiaceae bacterium]